MKSQQSKTKSSSADVRKMYEKFPYPSSQVGNNLIYDLAGMYGLVISSNLFEDAFILDLGCGTGHRIIGLAEQLPDSTFIGIDMSTPSLNIAKSLAAENGVNNVSFIYSEIENILFENKFDVVTSTGVFHHMEDPNDGFKSAFKALKADGIAIVWLYHAIGEYQRLINRELVQLLARADELDEYYLNVEIINKLNISLSPWKYGSSSSQHSDANFDKQTINVDAYLNPIVNAYSFSEIEKMFHDSGFSDVIMCGLNREGDSKIVNLGSNEGFNNVLKIEDLFDNDEDVIRRFNCLSYREKIRAIELCWKPTGITCIGLKTQKSFLKLADIFRATS